MRSCSDSRIFKPLWVRAPILSRWLPRWRDRLDAERGFTLLEILIVIVLTGVVTALLAIPGLRRYEEANRMRVATTQVQAAFSLARSRAAEMNRVVRVDFAPSPLTPAAGFLTVFVDLNRNGRPEPIEVDSLGLPNATVKSGVRGWELPRGIQFLPPAGAAAGPLGVPTASDGVSFTGDQIAVWPDGTVTEAGHITLGDVDGRRHAISISMGGSVRTWIYDGQQWR